MTAINQLTNSFEKKTNCSRVKSRTDAVGSNLMQMWRTIFTGLHIKPTAINQIFPHS